MPAVKSKALLKTSLLLIIIFIGVFSVLALSKLVDVGFCSADVVEVYPGQSINAALNSARDGDVILVKSGNYSESNIVVNKTVKIIGEDPETTLIDGGGTAQYIFFVTRSNVVIENITVRNTNPTAPSAAVYMHNVENITVKNVVAKDAFYGVQIRSSNFTKTICNRISDSLNSGVYIHGTSCNNTIAGNTFTNNPTAIQIASSACQFNRIYHNNFINNTGGEGYQVINNGLHTFFDGGYPSGGNYWSNHVAPDLRSGPDQDEVGSDGILDEGYPDPYSLWDKYPLAHPLSSLEVAVGGERFKVQVSTNSSLKSVNFDGEMKKLTLFLGGIDGTWGSCRVSIPKRLLSCSSLEEWKVSIYNGDRIEYLALDDESSTYLYFMYDHTGIEGIEIRGTVAIPEFSSTMELLLLLAVALVILILSLRKTK